MLDLRQLRIEFRRGEGLPVAQPWFQVRLHADSPPFTGTVESAWFVDDLHALRAALTGLAAAEDEVTFTVGGHRAAELTLTGGPSGDVVWCTVRLTPNGDDPYPALALLAYEESGRLVARLDGLDHLLEGLPGDARRR